MSSSSSPSMPSPRRGSLSPALLGGEAGGPSASSPAHQNHAASGDFGSRHSPIVSQSARGPDLGGSFGSLREFGVHSISAASGGSGGGGSSIGGHNPAAGFGSAPSASPLPAASPSSHCAVVVDDEWDLPPPGQSSVWGDGHEGSAAAKHNRGVERDPVALCLDMCYSVLCVIQ
jgi:hypothetical protein